MSWLESGFELNPIELILLIICSVILTSVVYKQVFVWVGWFESDIVRLVGVMLSLLVMLSVLYVSLMMDKRYWMRQREESSEGGSV
jgi:hypothetical protein